jgi:polysaccharide biosynthesis transport protein
MSVTPPADQTPERSLAYYLDLALRRWMLLLVPVVVAGATGAYLASGEPDVFRSSATIRVGDPSMPVGLDRSADVDQLLATGMEVIESKQIEREVFAGLPDEVTDHFVSIDVDRVEDTVLVELTVTATEGAAAATLAQTWAETYVRTEVDRTVGALNRRAEEIRVQSAALDEQVAGLAARIAEEAAAVVAQQDSEDPVIISGNETPTLSGLVRQRDALLAEQSDLREQANELQLEASLRGSVVEVAFPAEGWSGPFGGRPLRSGIIAAFLGLLLGGGLGILLDQLDDRLRTTDELESAEPGVSILGAVPGRLPRWRRRPLIRSAPQQWEAFQALRTNFEYVAGMREVSGRGVVVVVSSPLDGEGKSTVASNLAIALGSVGRAVVLVDADLRRGVLHEHLGAEAGPGVVDVMVGGEPVEEALHPVPLSRGTELQLLPGGRHLSPAELFATQGFSDLVAALASRADYVILDGAPTLPVSDALVLGGLADGVLLVVAAGRTRKPQLRATVEAFRQLDVELVGFVLNGVGKSPHGYYEPRPRTWSRFRGGSDRSVADVVGARSGGASVLTMDRTSDEGAEDVGDGLPEAAEGEGTQRRRR